jgi:hypothetical protein
MQNERRSLIIIFFYVIIMLLMCLFTVKLIQKSSDKSKTPTVVDTTSNNTANTVYIPVYIGTSPSESDTDISSETTDPETSYIVKNHKGKIGIFGGNGDLIQIIDVYIKTLPIADREMLEEGINIKNVDELRDIIEDYTG